MKYLSKQHDISWQRKIVSAIVSIFTFPLKLMRRTFNLGLVKRILIIQWDYLGDIITSTPALAQLRKLCPAADISLLTSLENKLYIDRFPYVNNIIYLQNPLHIGRERLGIKKILKCIALLRKNSYDLVIELSGRLPNQLFLPFLRVKYRVGYDPAHNFCYLDKRVFSADKHQIFRNIDVINEMFLPRRFECSIDLWNPATDKTRLKVKEVLLEKNVLPNKYIIIHPSASWEPRKWPAEKWASVVNYLGTVNRFVLFVGAESEVNQIKNIQMHLKSNKYLNMAGLLSVPETIALMESAEFFIGSDSGPMHLAATARLKGIILFGPGDTNRWGYDLHTIIYRKQKCSPCPQFAFRNKCQKGFVTCKGLLNISADDVIDICKKILLEKI